MFKNKFFEMLILIFGIMLVFSLTACDNGTGGDGGNGGIPSALVGKWYTQAGDLAFEITSADLFFFADQLYDVSVTGNTVVLKQGGTTVGAFDYAISNNEMTITNGMMVGQTVALLSPVVKGGGSNPSGPPSELVGTWYTQANDVAFEITSAGKILLANQSFDISVSGKTVSLKQGGTAVGTFDYAISNNTMTITNGTMVGMTVALLSPVVKGGGGNPPNPSVVPVTGVSLSSNTLTMAVGQTATLTATVMPSNATNKAVMWSVSPGTTSITVANGVVYANAVGTATITVTTVDGGKAAACYVTVMDGGNPITPSTYTVSFDTNGGYGWISNNPITVTAGSGITLPDGSGLYRDGYSFGGWNTDRDGWGESYYAGAWYTVYGNDTLYAMWMEGAVEIEIIEVSFDLNGGYGWIEPIRVEAGFSITLPGESGIYRDGYTFGGWSTDSSGTGTTYAAGSYFTPNSYYYGNYITLYAVWYANQSGTYIVTFDANGGSGVDFAIETVSAGSVIILPSGSGLSKAGYTFGGWSTISAAGTETNYSAGSSYTVYSNVTFYARWSLTSITVAGTEANPISLSKDTWTNGSITSTASGSAVWYSFTATGTATIYYVWWNDQHEGNSTKTLDVKVSAYKSGTSIFTNQDRGYKVPSSCSSLTSGTVVKIKVEPYTSGSTGTFAIGYSTLNSNWP